MGRIYAAGSVGSIAGTFITGFVLISRFGTHLVVHALLQVNTGVAKRDVIAVLGELGTVIERHVKKRGAGQFTLPGLLKIRTTRKPATKARKGRNPFTGEEIMIKAKPARTVVKISPLKNLKEMVD